MSGRIDAAILCQGDSPKETTPIRHELKTHRTQPTTYSSIEEELSTIELNEKGKPKSGFFNKLCSCISSKETGKEAAPTERRKISI